MYDVADSGGCRSRVPVHGGSRSKLRTADLVTLLAFLGSLATYVVALARALKRVRR